MEARLFLIAGYMNLCNMRVFWTCVFWRQV
jgi:hypothetical protein